MIIFCFLTYNDIIPIDYWNSFFKDIDSSNYQVWIHSKSNVNFKKYKFPIKLVKNKIQTISKSDISIVRATIQLFKESLEFNNNKNENNITHIIFCSQNCIPLYDFHFYTHFLKNINKSIISCIDNNLKERYYKLHSQFQNYISYEEFVKQQPNMILTKEDTLLIIKNDFTKYFENVQCPDEHYFINIFNYILKKSIIHSQTHFCNFNLNKTQALTFQSPSDKLLDIIRKQGFLFMRKVI